jgi:hypothetical protein
VAADLGVMTESIRTWIKQSEIDEGHHDIPPSAT